MVEVNVDHLVKLRERVKDAFQERYGIKITYLPMVVRATVDALLEYPDVNARLDGENIVRHRFVNIGIAVSYDAGLIVPVVKGADGMNTIGVARSIADLAGRARAHQLQPDEVQGATFTMPNPGPYGSVAIPINQSTERRDAVLRHDREAPHVVIDDTCHGHGQPLSPCRGIAGLSMASRDPIPLHGEAQPRELGFAEDAGV
jgi:hypothetical protein